jgi:hypothetical protein
MEKENLLNVNAYDIETYSKGELIIPFCICFYYDKKYYSFYGKNVIMSSIIKLFLILKNNTDVIYIHNLNFDGFLILEEVSKIKKFKIDFLVHKMKIYYLKISFSHKTIEFRCSSKILPASLNDISKSFNLPQKMPYPYKFINENTIYYTGLVYLINKWTLIDIKKYTISYCIRDVEITHKFVSILKKIFISDQNIDILKVLSSSSLSLKCFSLNFNYRKIPLKTKRSLDILLRQAYFGGRVEIFGNTNERVFHYDFPGMYGLIMQEKFPLNLPIWSDPTFININKLSPGFYSIKWKSDNIRIPILPVKNEFGKLMFPNGSNSGMYWFEEIQEFLKNGGCVEKIESALIYKECDYVFDKFVKYFNKFREKGGAYKVLGKLIINSLYGKLGSGIKETQHVVVQSKEDMDKLRKKEDILSITKLNNIEIVEIRSKRNIRGINVGMAAAITSKARIKLHKTMIHIENNGGRMLYCDTDSVFIEFKDKIDTSVSDWKNKDSMYDSAVFALPKTYALKKENMEIVKIKGVTKPSVKFDEFKKKFLEGDFLMFDELFQTKKTNFVLRHGGYNKKIDLSMYDKRNFSEDKMETKA